MPVPTTSRPPAEPRPSRWQVNATIAGAVVALLVLVADLGGAFDDNRTVGVVLAIGGAAVAAGTVYSFWGAPPVRTVRMHAALLAVMVGGFSITAAATAEGTDGVFAVRTMAYVGVAALVIAAVGLLAQARAAGLPTTPAPGTPRRKNR